MCVNNKLLIFRRFDEDNPKDKETHSICVVWITQGLSYLEISLSAITEMLDTCNRSVAEGVQGVQTNPFL